MCGSTKADKAEQTAAQSAADTARQQGTQAKKDIIAAGQPSAQENQIQSKAMGQMNKAPESLITDAGPISQAVSQRILERANNPGMDFDANSAAFQTAVGNPAWAGLKARGIAAPPGASGGGLGTQQYMKNVIPQLAGMRANQVNTDIANADTFSQQALGQNQYWTNLATAISQALQNRILSSTETGVPYQVNGMNSAEAINSAEVNKRYDAAKANNAAIAQMVGQLIGAAAGGAIGGPGGAMAGASLGGSVGGMAGGGGGGGGTNPAALASLFTTNSGPSIQQTSMGNVLAAPPNYYQSPAATQIAAKLRGTPIS